MLVWLVVPDHWMGAVPGLKRRAKCLFSSYFVYVWRITEE